MTSTTTPAAPFLDPSAASGTSGGVLAVRGRVVVPEGVLDDGVVVVEGAGAPGSARGVGRKEGAVDERVPAAELLEEAADAGREGLGHVWRGRVRM